MRLIFRFALPLLVVLGILAAALTPVTDSLIEHWFQRDVEMRSRLIFSSVQEAIYQMAERGQKKEIGALFDRIAEDERVLALGRCDVQGKLLQVSRSWPRGFSCPSPVMDVGTRIETVTRGKVLVASFRLSDATPDLGRIIILHDLGFVASRGQTARLYLMGFLTLFGLAAATVTILTARLTLRGWVRSLQHSLRGTGREGDHGGDPQIAPVISEIRHLLRDLDISRRTATGIRVDWSPDTLRRILDNELPDAQVIIVSNREPYIHNFDSPGTVRLQRPASGLVTALEPIMRACRGTWVAHGSGTADRETVDEHDHVAVPPDDPAYELRRIWLSDEEQEGYYYGLANEGLWPLCHITFVRPTFREPDWERYVAVNQKFADAVIQEARDSMPIVLVQDYHLALVPRMIREKLPQATVVTFWHIPWPNPEVFGICPWREKILFGLLGSSIVGFHTQLHCNNFLESADRFLESHIDRESATVSIGGHSTQVRPYPISIDWPPAALKDAPSVADCRRFVFERYSLPANTLLGVGVERFDFTKGIADRFRAIEILLDRHPEWIGKFVFLQIAAPTRSKLSIYQETQREAEAVAAAVNARYGQGAYRPIILISQHHEPDQVFELFRSADLCIVSSLHDGMNLVAKEFIAARDDEKGVLILSTFAGASRELLEAVIVNPFDARASAEAIDKALRMPLEQQAERMRYMRELVGENNVYYWAGRMILDASRIRKRGRIDLTLSAAQTKSSKRD